MTESTAATPARGTESQEYLPPHYPSCFGCGPDALEGLRIRARWQDGMACAMYTFSERHQGAPDYAHGGAIAALFGLPWLRSLIRG